MKQDKEEKENGMGRSHNMYLHLEKGVNVHCSHQGGKNAQVTTTYEEMTRKGRAEQLIQVK